MEKLSFLKPASQLPGIETSNYQFWKIMDTPYNYMILSSHTTVNAIRECLGHLRETESTMAVQE
jgi:hypothetical protein